MYVNEVGIGSDDAAWPTAEQTEDFVNASWENDGNGVCVSFQDNSVLEEGQYAAMFVKIGLSTPDYLNQNGNKYWWRESSLPVIRGDDSGLNCPDCDVVGLPIV